MCQYLVCGVVGVVKSNILSSEEALSRPASFRKRLVRCRQNLPSRKKSRELEKKKRFYYSCAHELNVSLFIDCSWLTGSSLSQNKQKNTTQHAHTLIEPQRTHQIARQKTHNSPRKSSCPSERKVLLGATAVATKIKYVYDKTTKRGRVIFYTSYDLGVLVGFDYCGSPKLPQYLANYRGYPDE